MTKNEKITIGISIASIVISLIGSILSPIIAFHWLDPKLQEYQRSAKLQLTPTDKPIKVGEFTVPKPQQGKPIVISKSIETFLDSVYERPYEIYVVNISPYPAKEALLTVQYPTSNTNTAPPNPTFNPPVLTEISTSGNEQYIRLKTPIAPNEKIEVRFGRLPKAIWAWSENGHNASLIPAPFVTWSGGGGGARW
jgi:hypothetical protein